jgi:iron complex transport system substrate-binding protein
MARFVLAVALILLSGCGGSEGAPAPASSPDAASPEAAFPVTVTDDEGAETTLAAAPDRIVTFAPSHTEIVFALGRGDRLVGVSGDFDDYPPEAQDIEAIGGAGGVEPNIEKVVALDPDILLTAFIGGEWKDRLRELDVPVFTTLASSFDDAVADIEVIADLLEAEEEGRALADDLTAQAEAVETAAAGQSRVTCFLDFGDLFTAGPGSLEFDLLERAGCDPVTASTDEPYPQWSAEQLVQDDPDVYLAAEGTSVEQVARQPGLADLTAVRQGRIEEVDSDVISRPGPRMVEGLEALAAALHAEEPAA